MADPRDVFGPSAERYRSSDAHANEAELAHCVAIVRPRGGRVLDVGTGPGHTAFAFAPYADAVIGLDPTPEMLGVLRAESVRRGIDRVVGVEGYAEALPFADGTFEGVATRSAAHHFRSVPRFLAEARRVLAPDGWLLVVDTVGVDDAEADDQLDRIEFQRDPSHVRDYTRGRWLKMVAEAGFKPRISEVFPRPLNLEGWLDRLEVREPMRQRLTDAIMNSRGWLREYFRPHGEGGEATFHLHQIVLVADRRTTRS
jgi:ubiquinone/menaquinone biosynthesis C-methylase UbiE